jgi:hypothetical protein
MIRGTWDVIKRVIFVTCFAVNTVFAPIGTVIWMSMIAPKRPLSENIYSEWMFTFMFMTLMPSFLMLLNFFTKPTCGGVFDPGPYSLEKFKKVILGKPDENEIAP